jgi:hypothetical protein
MWAMTERPSDELVNRMVAFCRRCNDLTSDSDFRAPFVGAANHEDERELARLVRAIVVDLSDPIDPIEAVVTEVLAEWDVRHLFVGHLSCGYEGLRVLARMAARRGRELERQS